MKNTTRRQRGAGVTIPVFGDANLRWYANKNVKTDLDKELGRLDIYSKMQNMKELVSWIYFENGNVMSAASKSNTSIFTQIGKRYFINPYTDPNWFDKNFITSDQMIRNYAIKRHRFCDIIVRYLKQLYILITGSNNGFPEREREHYECIPNKLPDIDDYQPTEQSIEKLRKIFGQDVMNKFIENYKTVKDVFIDALPRKHNNEIQNPPNNNEIQNPPNNNEIQNPPNNNEIQNPPNNNEIRNPLHYNNEGGTRKTRRRRRNKSNKRRKTRK